MFNFFKKNHKIIEISSPLSGNILPLSESPDEAFAQEMMGEGICINPDQDTIYAPLDCTIDIFHTLHAVGCKVDTIELIIHIGMNTVLLNGKGFTALVPLQGQVKVQTPLIKFDKGSLLSQEVDTLITPIVITDKPEKAQLEILKNTGFVQVGEPIMRIIL